MANVDWYVEGIEFEVDLEGRTAWVNIPGVLESTGRPITSPVSGDPHRSLYRA